MRIWGPVLIVGTLLAYVILTNIGSSLALADIAGRPVVALMRADGASRVTVPIPGQAATPGQARQLGGEGVLFGYRFTYRLPDAAQIFCTIRFRSLTCSDGWVAERLAGTS